MNITMNAHELIARLADPETAATTVILHAYSGDGPVTKGIAGAHVADLEGDFSDHSQPLPHTKPADLPGLLEGCGISDDTTVVVYDAQRGSFAPRVWWLLKVAGVENSFLLDGGLKSWLDAGQPLGDLVAPSARGTLSVAGNPDLLIDAPEVANGERLVVDARAAKRFNGEVEEPRPGLRRGHIPGAVNLPFMKVYDKETSKFLPAEELKALFESVVGDRRDLTFSCGSGVTACVLAAAAGLAGYTDLKVYEGSWSDWGREDSGYPVEQ